MKTLMNRRTVVLSLLAVGAAVLIPAKLLRAADKETMTALDAYGAAKSGKIILVDIRTPGEWADTGVAEGAVAYDMQSPTFLEDMNALRAIYPDKPIAVICRSGSRSNYVVTEMNKNGFKGLVDVTEGMGGGRNGAGWVPQGLPVYKGTKGEIMRRRLALSKP